MSVMKSWIFLTGQRRKKSNKWPQVVALSEILETEQQIFPVEIIVRILSKIEKCNKQSFIHSLRETE